MDSIENLGKNIEFTLHDVTNLLLAKLVHWFEVGVQSLPNILVAIFFIIFTAFLAKMIRSLSLRLLDKISTNIAINRLLASFIYFMVFVAGFFVALGILKLEKTVTSLLAGAGIIGLTLGLAFQEITSNFVSGILIAFRKPIAIGDMIEVNGVSGWVDRMNLRTTVLRTLQGQDAFIPNKDLLNQTVINFSKTGKRRIDIPVGISYGEDLQKVETVTQKALEEVSVRDPSEPVEILFQEFGNSSINFVGRFWVKFPGDNHYFRGIHEGVKRIKSAFDANHIVIPFPIRTLDFGIKGGKTLSDVLVQSKVPLEPQNK